MSQFQQPSRREFLKRTAAASSAIAAPTIIPARVLGLENTPPPSEQVLIGVIGVGSGQERQGEQNGNTELHHGLLRGDAQCHERSRLDTTRVCSLARDL